MDLFNKNKLSEKEAEIGALRENSQWLEKKISQLEAQIIELKEEKQREIKLHQDVVDTMLGEVQAFISANRGKKLSYMTLETLLPLIDEVLEKHSFLFKIEIDHFYYQIFSSATQKDLAVAHCEYIIDKLKGLQMVGNAIVENVQMRDSKGFFKPSVTYQIDAIFSVNDFRKKLDLININTFEITGKTDIKFKDMTVTKDGDCLIFCLRNIHRRKQRGF